MNQIIKPETVDFNTLIKNNTALTIDCQSKMIETLNKEFTEEENRWYIANLYIYMNYHPTNDYPINLETLIKLVDFANKQNAKRTLVNNFIEGEDYKILLIPKDEQVKTNGGAGLNKERVMMNIDTFKNMCMLVKTEKSKEIRKYYVKLENIYNKIIKEEIENTQKLLEEKEQLLEEKDKKIEQLIMKPETEGFHTKPGYIYLIKDTASGGAYKIGLAENPDKRLITLNISSSQKALKMISIFNSKNTKHAEKMIHILLEPFRIKKRNEWFYLSNDIELNYTIYTIKNIISYTDKYDFLDYTSFKNYAEMLTNNLQEMSDENYEEKIKIEIPEKFTNNNFMSKKDKLSNYNGVSWSINMDKWTSRLTKDNETLFLGYYETELEAAIIYNDYASYLNQTNELHYKLNDIENYIPKPRNIPEEMKKIKLENKSSNYNGVYFIKSKQIFEASIQYKKKSYKLIKHLDDLECAKVYNEQALYFNNHFGTKYKLNDIEDQETVEKNHIHNLEMSKVKKYSRFIGVSIRNDSNKFRSYIKHNGKIIHCGTFTDEIDAAKSYNKKAEELNLLDGFKYRLNEIE